MKGSRHQEYFMSIRISLRCVFLYMQNVIIALFSFDFSIHQYCITYHQLNNFLFNLYCLLTCYLLTLTNNVYLVCSKIITMVNFFGKLKMCQARNILVYHLICILAYSIFPQNRTKRINNKYSYSRKE